MKKKCLILAEGSYGSGDAKTAHGLVRYSQKFTISGIIDSTLEGKDAGEILDGNTKNIRIYADLKQALQDVPDTKYLLIGVATSGGILPEGYIDIILKAIRSGINIVNGLHFYLTDDPELVREASDNDVELIDVRKMFNMYHTFFSGKIDDVSSRKIAVLGIDSAIGKRTTAIMLHHAIEKCGKNSTFVAMGQTGWMQGFKYAIVLDAIILDFVTGAIEDVIWQAWKAENPDFIVTHGEGALLHPACPGGAELIGGGQPDHIILQHAPARRHFDDFPQYKIVSLQKNIDIIELLSGKKPVAITINSEELSKQEAFKEAERIEEETGIMTRLPLFETMDDIAQKIIG